MTALTSLTSRTNGLITLYDISRSKDSLLHLNTPPYHLWPKNEDKNPCYGRAFFQHPLASHDDFSMFQLSDRGSILQFGLYDSRPSNNRFSVLMSEEMDKLEQRASALFPDDGPLGCRDFSEVDFVSPYDCKPIFPYNMLSMPSPITSIRYFLHLHKKKETSRRRKCGGLSRSLRPNADILEKLRRPN